MSDIKVTITNELARVVGLIANKHRDCSVEILWRDGTPEIEWLVTADNGSESWSYIVDDEQGIWSPLSTDDQEAFNRGESVFMDMERRIREAAATT